MTAKRPKRLKREMIALDGRIRPLYQRGLGCRKIAAALVEDPATIFKRVRRMGILRTTNVAAAVNVTAHEVPFTNTPTVGRLRAAAIGDAIRWFSARGYTPSVPVEVAHYDLVVESDAGFKRVQVKTTTFKDHGRFVARVARHHYDKTTSIGNAAGKRRFIPYSADDVDLFYILTGGGDRYIVPIGATDGCRRITLDVKYARYRLTEV